MARYSHLIVCSIMPFDLAALLGYLGINSFEDL
jgi:hypothetical protein